MGDGFLNKFRRITSSTQYLPEIDGLRFLAIFWVAVCMHSIHYLDSEFYHHQLLRLGYWQEFVMEGTHGMFLFFMISGFILSLPFARAYMADQGERINLKRYYLRRLTRLEAPYIIALLIFFVAHVFVVKNYTLQELVPSLFASLFYSHDLIYVQHSYILPVAWSLEIEVQFYLLAPLFCLLFRIKNPLVRRLIMLTVIIAGAWSHVSGARHVHVFRFMHYFFAGILLADLYVSRKARASDSLGGYVLGIVSLLALFVFISLYTPLGLAVKFLIMFLLFYQVLFNKQLKAVFSARWITIIGGMCYSIYLLHYGLISAFGTLMLSTGFNVINPNYAPLCLLLITGVILAVCAAYFYFIEKPFMRFNMKRSQQKAVGDIVT